MLFYYFWGMEIFVFFAVGVLLLLGVIGSIIPVLPGPPISYVALLIYHFFIHNIDLSMLIWIGVLVAFITIFDYYLQIYGVKRAGGGRYAIRGSLVGILLGIILLPPIGILLGAFIGAFIGAKIEMDANPLKIAFGSLLGFAIGTILKLVVSVYIIFILF